MTAPICLCVVASHKETDESAEAAMNAPLLAKAMHMGLLLVLRMHHCDSVVLADMSTQ